MEYPSITSSHSSIYVAPLQFGGKVGASTGAPSTHSKTGSSHSNVTVYSNPSAQITPPPTPQRSTDALVDMLDSPPPDFHNFLRAYYAFHPEYDEDSETVTLPLNEGDLILVHSIHTNGWADGTLLTSGARGWLPTNYCVTYEEESMQVLLKALVTFWDLFRGDGCVRVALVANEEYMKSIVAGVRSLLENSQCLTREAHAVQVHDGLRRHRKALLSELSSLVKLARTLPHQISGAAFTDHGEYTVDEMIRKAYKIVVRGVKFLDIWNHFVESTMTTERFIPAISDSGNVPPTPPADYGGFEAPLSDAMQNARAMNHYPEQPIGSAPALTNSNLEQSNQGGFDFSNTSVTASRPSTALSSRVASRADSHHARKPSAAHRISYSGFSTATQKNNLASQRLSATHDIFLSHQGSFIGRLHLQSRSSPEILMTTQQSVTACRGLMAVVDAVFKRDSQRAEALEQAKDSMYTRITELVGATRDVFQRSEGSEDYVDVITPDESKKLMCAATSCVRAAGECVANTKFVIERIGDFELSQEDLLSLNSLHVDIPLTTSIDITAASDPENLTASMSSTPSTFASSFPLPESGSNTSMSSAGGYPSTDTVVESPLEESTTSSFTSFPASQPSSTRPVPLEYASSPVRNHFTPDFPPSPTRVAPGLHDVMAMTKQDDLGESYKNDSNESCTLSQTSTRAVTPESQKMSRVPLGMQHESSDSQLNLAIDDTEETEAKLLEKTHAHELIYNKEGQIMGGTLPALVERLTTHDSTPDSTFVSTFYLTFRLFTTPLVFSQALVGRFQDVANISSIAGPVRLRVYNVFKGWLESQWNNESDQEALPIIQHFAIDELQPVFPAAGKRLVQLMERASIVDGPLVPRIVPSIGRATGAAITAKSTPEAPLPSPIVSKSQLSALKNWKLNGNTLSILDFDPLELARQFTVKESKLFCSILPEELLAAEWMKKTSTKAVNVRAMSTLSTNLSTLVADTILQLEDVKKRATMIKQWIKIAKKCLKLNNYDSLMAIVCSLNNSTILRLKRTWEVVSHKSKATFEELRSITSVTRNYAVLRQRLQNHVPPCLPFVGTYLTDLTFVDVGNQTTRQLPGEGESQGLSVINFDKYMKTAKIIGDVQRFQAPYKLVEVPELQEWMDAQILRIQEDSSKDDVQGHYRRSLLLEPRESHTQRPSLADTAQSSFTTGTKDKFDFLAWAHHGKDKSVTAST
ncbi:MAG: hypothetical protein M4579_001199 [Chaenotheca gracillima]|nr:MAG: hypothetical protein M4579_001199 [Chaenotheca gracillima]